MLKLCHVAVYKKNLEVMLWLILWINGGYILNVDTLSNFSHPSKVSFAYEKAWKCSIVISENDQNVLFSLF